MYCIECGLQIQQNSKFCPNCGKRQVENNSVNEKFTEIVIDKDVANTIKKIQNSAVNYDFLRKAVGWYVAWVLLNLAILLIWSKSIAGEEYYSDKFFPFSERSKIKSYDFREFLVYTIFPFAILFAISLIHNPRKKTKEII